MPGARWRRQAGNLAPGVGGEDHLVRLGDEIADGQDDAVLADHHSAAATFGAEHGRVRQDADRERGELTRVLFGEKRCGAEVHIGRSELEVGQLVLLGDELRDLGVRDRAAFDEQLSETPRGEAVA